MTFARASAMRRTGPGAWAGEVAPGWDIVGNANGGYLLAMAGRAMLGETERPDPVTVTAHYLAPGKPGPVRAEVDVVRAGKRFSTARALLVAEDRPVLAVLGSFSDLAQLDGPTHMDGGPPDLPPVEACVRAEPGDPLPPPFADKVDLRMDPADAGFYEGRPSGRLRMGGWLRLPDGEPMDTLGLLLAADSFPPTIFNGDLPVAWTPTLELTVHVRRRPAPGWLRCITTTRFVSNGFLEVDGEIWDASDHLVVQSRQVALVPRTA
jgi:acyl-CoA thioesterase